MALRVWESTEGKLGDQFISIKPEPLEYMQDDVCYVASSTLFLESHLVRV